MRWQKCISRIWELDFPDEGKLDFPDEGKLDFPDEGKLDFPGNFGCNPSDLASCQVVDNFNGIVMPNANFFTAPLLYDDMRKHIWELWWENPTR